VRTGRGRLPEFEKLLHDRLTGATLLVHPREGKVYRLGDSSCTELKGILAPPLPTRYRGVLSLPSNSCLVDVSGRRLIWLDHDDAWGNYELDLTWFLDQCGALDTLDP
jgi:hypothetical protein